jgi:VWFA-related protein
MVGGRSGMSNPAHSPFDGAAARRWTALALVGLAVAGAGGPASAQAPESGAAASSGTDVPIFMESVDVDVVNVDVHVTGPDGRPVTGLTAADFEVFEDGQPVAITNFYVVEDGRRLDAPSPSAPAGERAASASPPPLAAPAATPADVAEDRLHLVVFVDNFNLRSTERNRVLDDVTTFLARTLRREDRAMLAAWDGSFKVLHPFTTDPFAIDRELHELRDSVVHLPQRDGLRREAITDLDRARSAQAALASVRVYADMVRTELEVTFGALRELIDHLAGLPGRKAVLHVSSGIPMLVGEELFYAIERKFGDSSAMSYAPHYDLSRRWDEIARRANANRVSFYMLDAGGLRPHGAGVDEQGLRTPGLAASLASDYEANHHSPLRYLAAETGGQAIVNRNDVMPALQDVRQALRSFYSLGFRPSQEGDQAYHRIKVKVPGRNVRVEHRAGYQYKTVDTNMRESTMAALYHFYEENPLGLDVALADAAARDGGTYLVSLRLTMPVERMTLLPVGASREARLHLYVAVMDGEGKVSDVERFPLGLRLAEEHVAAALRERFVHTQRLVVGGGRQKIAIGLRDDLSGEATFLARTVVPGSGS